MSREAHTDFVNACRKIGWKCTSQRRAVYDFLQGNRTHPDVDTVWRAVKKNLPSITRESVYRILNELAGQGFIGRLDHIDSARYDSCPAAHGHFICGECGKIADFDWPEGVVVPPDFSRAQVHHMEVRLVGVCPACAAGAKQNPQVAVKDIS